jgi:hypothetical protein
MGDIVDGSVWQEFQTMPGVPGEPLLMPSGNGLGMMLNTDGFQPADDRQYNVTATYLVLLNLPRHMRYRKENMILIGLIPDGSHRHAEAGRAYATFTDIMVDELMTLWDGSSRLDRRAVVVCVACDSPAARDLGGFTGTGSRREGPRRVTDWSVQDGSVNGQPDFGRANTHGSFAEAHAFPIRTRENWVTAGKAWLSARTKTAREQVRQDTGCRHSPLMRLPYLRPTLFPVDPMHCFYEGVWKDFLTMTLANELSKTSSALLNQWESEVARWRLPRSVGPIAGKLKSKLAGLKAAELKNLLDICMYTLVDGDGDAGGGARLRARSAVESGDEGMEEEVSYESTGEYNLLVLLVDMSAIIGCGYVGSAQIDSFQHLAMAYCNLYEDTYGSTALKPNHRQLLELAECMRQYGPGPAFWLFALERWNGQIQQGAHKFSDIECSMMRTHVHQIRLRSLAAAELERADATAAQQSIVGQLLGRNADEAVGMWPAWREPLEADVTTRWNMETLRVVPVSELIVGYIARLDQPDGAAGWSNIRGDEWLPGALTGRCPAWFNPDMASLRRSLAAIFRSPTFPCTPADVTVGAVVGCSTLSLCGAEIRAASPHDPEVGHASCVIVTQSAGEAPPPDRFARPPPVEAVMTPGLVEGFVTVTVAIAAKGTFTLKLARVHWFEEAYARPGSHIQRYHRRKFNSVAPGAAHADYAYVPVQRLESSFVPLSHRLRRELFSVGTLAWPFLF